MPGFWKILKKSFVDSYECLGLVLVSSVVWFGVVLCVAALVVKIGRCCNPAILLGSAVVLYMFLVAPVTAGVYALAKKIVVRDDPSLLDLSAGFREFLTASWALGFAQAFITFVIAVNAWFYLTHGGPALRILGILFVYLFLFWVFSAIYHFPILIEQRPGVLKILKRGFLLTMGNMTSTIGLFSVIILLTCFCIATLVGLPLLYSGMASILQTRALRALFVRYELLPPEKEYTSDENTATEKA